jgi:hypothetical protein
MTAFSTRRQFLTGGLAGAGVLLLAGCSTTSTTQPINSSSVTPPPAPPGGETAIAAETFAYLQCLTNGKWSGPASGGNIDQRFISDLTSRVAGEASPQYVKFTTNCNKPGHEVPAEGSPELAAARALASAGIKLGVAINSLEGISGAVECLPSATPGKGKNVDGNDQSRCLRTVDDVIHQAASIKTASDNAGGLYDWMFLDFAWGRTPAGKDGLNDLQEIIDGITRAGWAHIMINATGFSTKDLQFLPERTWGMARHFTLFERRNLDSAIAQSSTGLEEADEDFIRYVQTQRNGAKIVLKLEHPHDVGLFGKLPTNIQDALLTKWATNSKTGGWQQLYPIYTTKTGSKSGPVPAYDAASVGTLTVQRRLLAQN